MKMHVYSIKKYLNATERVMWFHDGECDGLSMFGSRHLHIITHIPDFCGEPRRAIFNFAPFKKLKTDSKKTTMCIKTQRVKYLENLVYHFMQPPKIYMGSR